MSTPKTRTTARTQAKKQQDAPAKPQRALNQPVVDGKPVQVDSSVVTDEKLVAETPEPKPSLSGEASRARLLGAMFGCSATMRAFATLERCQSNDEDQDE
jgi:hypothetical protein